jgi:SAM-dependent methyltransferase
MTARRLEREWLDHLPADDPRALGSRRDLRRVNAAMGHFTLMTKLLLRHGRGLRPRMIVDLGAGDGTFALRLARALAPVWPSVTMILVDRQELVRDDTRTQFAALGWHVEAVVAEACDFLTRADRCDVLVANLFLHHLDAQELTELFVHAGARTRLVVACEPRRASLPLFFSRLLWALGCNDVTMHDAPASVRAGFKGRELSAMWPRPGGWKLCEYPAGLFSHYFVARRVN